MTTDQSWQAISAILTVVAIYVSIILAVFSFYSTRHEASKAIEATVISRSQLLNPEVHTKPSDLHLLFKNHEIFDIGILQIRVRNSGAQPIQKADIEGPITIAVEGATEIISAPVVQKYPPTLPIETTISGTKVELTKTLLNPDDAVTVEIDAITAEGGKLDISEVSGHVAGVQKIALEKTLPEQFEKEPGFSRGVLLGLLISFLVADIFFLIYAISRAQSR